MESVTPPPVQQPFKRWLKNPRNIRRAVVFICVIWFLNYAGCLSFRSIAPVRVGDVSRRPHNKEFLDAIRNDDLLKVKSMLDKGADPNSVDMSDNDGTGSLDVASETGDLRLVKLLVARGADINAQSFWGSNAALSASVAGEPEVLQFLIDHGADVNVDDDGVNALDYAEHQLEEVADSPRHERFAQVVDELHGVHARHSTFLLFARFLSIF